MRKILLLVSPLLAACTVEGSDAPTPDTEERGALGKADLVGSCEHPVHGELCGGKGKGNCWCDDLCVEYGDCCSDAADVCGIDVPPPEGQPCGGWLGDTCGEGEFCMFEPGATCGWADGSGTCEEIPQACILVFDPVCGCDGQTYGNACQAHAAGTSVLHEGECEETPEEPPQFCGGIAGFPCPPGQMCIDDPGDDCDPQNGGADCGGICVPEEEPEGQFCGGIAGIPCPEGMICVDDGDDDCDPALGGADCGGVCVPEKPELDECHVAGCSGELCVGPDGPDVSICIFEDWYVCLELTQCGNFGPGGSCGWEPNQAYLDCLASF